MTLFSSLITIFFVILIGVFCYKKDVFDLSYFRLRPKATAPRVLNKKHWEKAWQIVQEKLPGYSQTYGSES